MAVKEITNAGLFNLIDEWFDKNEKPFIVVEDKNGTILSGEVIIPNINSYYLPQNRPWCILINKQPINLTNIRSVEVADVKYEVVE